MTKLPLVEFLKPTQFINSNHPTIIEKVNELIRSPDSPPYKARTIFYFIRDQIKYEFKAKFVTEQYIASNILQNGKGFCIQKAILFCALARAAGIPAGIYFYDIVDHTLPRGFVRLMQTNILYHHGITALFLNGTWYRYDATLHLSLVQKNKFIPVEFSPHQDCLMHDHTLTAQKHIEYLEEYGLFADVSFNQIMGWFRKGYPQLFQKYHRRQNFPHKNKNQAQ